MRLQSYRKHVSKPVSGKIIVRARVTIAGKDYLLGEFGSKESKQKYNRLSAEWLASDQSKTFGIQVEEIVMVELLSSYMKSMKKYYGDGPESEYRRSEQSTFARRHKRSFCRIC